MSSALPAVSVLMCVHNDERYVAAAIQSILRQSYKDFEFVIVLDAPSDNSAAIVRAFNDPRIAIISLPTNVGLTRALNTGLARCQGEWIVRQDADDISLPDRIKSQLAFVTQHKDVVLVGTQALKINDRGKRISSTHLPQHWSSVRWFSLLENPFIHSSVMFNRKIAYDKLGGYDESFTRTQDFDLWSKLLREYRAENLATPLLLSRVHATSISSSKGPASDGFSKRVISDNLKYFGIPVTYSDILHTHRAVLIDDTTAECAQLLPNVLNEIECYFLAKDPEFKNVLPFVRYNAALALVNAGYKIAGFHPGIALSLVKKALSLSPKVLFRLPITRLMARIFFGERLFQLARMRIRNRPVANLN